MVKSGKDLENVTVKATKISFTDERSGYTIARFKIKEEDGFSKNTFSVKGNYSCILNRECIISAKYLETHDLYGDSYQLIDIQYNHNITDDMPIDDKLAHIQAITSERVARELIKIPNIIEVIESGNMQTLMEQKYVGQATAKSIIEKHEKFKKDIKTINYLKSEFGMTDGIARKAINEKNISYEDATTRYHNNVYLLMDISGIGFKKADEYFLFQQKDNLKNAYKDIRRIEAYINDLFDSEYFNGHSYLISEYIFEKIGEFIPEVDPMNVAETIQNKNKYQTFIVNGEIRVMKNNVLRNELIVTDTVNQLLNRQVRELHYIDETLVKTQMKQGFDFDDDQIRAIKEIVNSNIYLLQGGAGVGKSSVIKGVTDILEVNGLLVANCAISGKAVKNIQQITGTESYTMERLILSTERGIGNHIGRIDKETGTWVEFDAVIIDEISMVDLSTFARFLNKLGSKTRVIMVGDLGQLPAIGVGVAKGIVECKDIPNFTLNKIHRQASESAIITHSRAIRENHYNLNMLDYGLSTFGTNKDMQYLVVKKESELESIKKNIFKIHDKYVEKYSINDVIIATQTRKLTDELNIVIQEKVNPLDKLFDNEYVSVGNRTFRVNDRVMNLVNNYDVEPPIFNGDTGTILSFNEDTFEVEIDGLGTVRYPNEILSDFTLAYACTIHKLQGSTIKGVIIALPFQYMLNTKELVYTAITRASKSCLMITSKETLRFTLRNNIKESVSSNLELFLSKAKDTEYIKKLKERFNNVLLQR